ncbi:PREDICTED: glycoprotein 3-alpha-L-fucosyltransferase A-like [Priapulus caudatus]|uniref:Fucosyltransferase n=1 Tax=Priapulus caudatus TaxID=37621 RepID=A0ABM1E913_PRICU|nr:PREDICTED: glycoprotein 3-alpha-L-fucosyltransferase A-like [Priapulus caudatus]
MRAEEHNLPAVHRPSQPWLFYSLEPPPVTHHTGFRGERYPDFFNWTMTYRRDSDFWLPYRSYRATTAPRSGVRPNYARGKTKLAVAIISNCAEERLRFVRRLAEVVPVDVYGRCGKGKVCTEARGAGACMRDLLRPYKFYIAAENSRCADYVTEKYWRSIGDDLQMVPIVVGPPADDYAAVVIPGSYVHADSFESVGALGAYMKRADANDTLYSELFAWRERYVPIAGSYTRAWCEFCKALHESPVRRRTFPNFGKWWEGSCK